MKTGLRLALVAFFASALLASVAQAGPKKMSRDQAKKECLKDKPDLAGKKLQACIKKKRK